ncbi:MAG: F0F1 ATP synthase subunit gamma [Candidatus Saccharimonadales bacterium]|nr:F0F1 ATP synthase subunit gamma [Candidatus Saccharimonadales bacterium]
MRHPNEVKDDMSSIDTIVNLTGIFEGIASLKIAQIKNQVLQSQNFFRELWGIYTQLRVDATFHFGRSQSTDKVIDKELFIVITAEGGFSGDIDEKLIKTMLKDFDPEKQDIIVIGHHGAIQLSQRGVSIKKYYKLPSRDRNINVSPIIAEIQKYRTSSAYYQQYVSLMVQDVRRISMVAAVQEQGLSSQKDKEKATESIISEENYIFEPSTYAVVDHLERSMLSIMLSQIILDSKLAQYASRFRAMSAANDRAREEFDDLQLQFNRARRSLADERLKEIVAGLKKARAAA